jgi:hypothetical protein
MGKQVVVNREIGPEEAARVVIKALQSGTYTIAQVQQMFPGFMVVGDYKGYGAILDIDKLVCQPLVKAERLHILGILDGREEDYDLQTIRIPNGSVAGASVRERLTVPAGEVWFVSAVRLTTPADQGGTPAINWRCSLWEDRLATPDADGQAFHANPLSNTPAGNAWTDEFYPEAPGVAIGNKGAMLRLPAGSRITAVATNLTAAATGNMDCTLALYGYVGKSLVG